jgi:hypothetical protein
MFGCLWKSVAITALLAATVLLVPAESFEAQPEPKLVEMGARMAAARAAGDSAGWLEWGSRALARVPDHPDLLINVARASAATGQDTAALKYLDDAARRGAGFDPASWPEFSRLKDLPALRPIAERGRANLVPVNAQRLLAVLPPDGSEGVAYDPVSHCIFAGTNDGRILQVTLQGVVTEFSKGEGLRQLLGLKIDARRRLLWAVNGRYPDADSRAHPTPDLGLSELRAFRLADAKPAGIYVLDERPTLHGFNDIALGENGDVYVTDSPMDSVYRLRDGKLTLFTSGPDMSEPNGIALAPDQRRLFVATIEGLVRVDLMTGQRVHVQTPANAAVNSIDGLLWWHGSLVGVQSSPFLARIIKIDLDKEGARIVRVSRLNARTPAEYSQSDITADDRVLYVAAGFPARYPDGRRSTAAPSPRILVVSPH